MTESELRIDDLDRVAEDLLSTARDSKARRAASTLYGGRDAILRQTMIALLSDVDLAEHESPPEATIHVLRGSVQLRGVGREWELGTGAFMPIPPERHSVHAIEDSVLLLTVVRASSRT